MQANTNQCRLHAPDGGRRTLLITILGIIGAVVATYLGQAIGRYRVGEGAGLLGAIVGALVVLFVWSMIANRSAPA